jgi:hypothetical protein
VRSGQACQRRGRRWWVPPVAAGLALLALAAWGIGDHQVRLPTAGAAPAWAQSQSGRDAAEPAAARPAASPAGKTLARGLPVRSPERSAPAMPAVLPVGAQSVQIPSLRVSALASPQTVTAGALGVPGDPADVGWWMPTVSELVIDGHVDMAGDGPGALFEVRNLRPGAQVLIQTAGGPEHWTIDGVRSYRKGHVPAGLFSWQGTSARLVIITCGGPFNDATHHYYDNVVAYGSPSRSKGA